VLRARPDLVRWLVGEIAADRVAEFRWTALNLLLQLLRLLKPEEIEFGFEAALKTCRPVKAVALYEWVRRLCIDCVPGFGDAILSRSRSPREALALSGVHLPRALVRRLIENLNDDSYWSNEGRASQYLAELGELAHDDLFDAIEHCHFYTPWINYNRPAQRLAQGNAIPLLGGSDAHLPCQFGRAYSLIEADPNPEGVLSAIRSGRVRVVSQPLKSHILCAIGVSLVSGAVLQAGWGLTEALWSGLSSTIARAYASVRETHQPESVGVHWRHSQERISKRNGH